MQVGSYRAGQAAVWGPTGQGKLLCDIHSALIRVLEGLDEDLWLRSATDLAP